jgi:uncharacterized protein (TIGR02453 family)
MPGALSARDLAYALRMAFSGWPIEAVEFYEGLQADNTKTYWTANKGVYDRSVHGPMVDLLAELAGEFGEGRIFRPYRDIRFRADKSPYKTSIYATLARGGFVRFSAEGLTAATGYYGMAPDQLDRYRRAVADDERGTALAAVVDSLTARKIEVGGAATLKSAPRGYPRDHPRVELLRYKGLIAWREWPVGAWLGTSAAKGRVVDLLHTAAPLTTWLDEHVGPTTAEPDRPPR